MVRKNFWSGIVVASFAVLALTWIIPNYAGTNPFARMPPDLVPSIAAWIMLICGVIITAGAVIEMIRSGQKPITTDIDWRGLGWALWPFVYVGAAIYFLSLFKITYVGIPLIAGLLLLLGERRWYMLLGCSVVPVLLLYMLSVYMMRIGMV